MKNVYVKILLGAMGKVSDGKSSSVFREPCQQPWEGGIGGQGCESLRGMGSGILFVMY